MVFSHRCTFAGGYSMPQICRNKHRISAPSGLPGSVSCTRNATIVPTIDSNALHPFFVRGGFALLSRFTVLSLFFLLPGICRSEPPSIKPFTTDECTLVDEGPPEDPNAWCHCCVAHDLNYWKGGTAEEKERADQEFKRCIAAAGYPDRARVMYNAVRIWGGAYLPAVWRWGYGWPYGRGYKELTEEEEEAVEKMLLHEETRRALDQACKKNESRD